MRIVLLFGMLAIFLIAGCAQQIGYDNFSSCTQSEDCIIVKGKGCCSCDTVINREKESFWNNFNVESCPGRECKTCFSIFLPVCDQGHCKSVCQVRDKYCLYNGPSRIDAEDCKEGYTQFGAGLCNCNQAESLCVNLGKPKEQLICGTEAGFACPEGYECTGMDMNIVDAQGICKKAETNEENNTEEPKICAGFAGLPCPNGYICTDIPPDVIDGTGICKKIDLNKAKECLSKRKVTIVCSTEFNCSKQREAIGDLFDYLKVEYDDSFTDCSQYGNLCEDEYNDVEMVGWIVPNKPPYRTEYNNYPAPSFRGTRNIDSVLWIAGCEPVVVE